MNLAKISANGQITVPIEIRKALGINAGDKILFIKKPTGEIVICNAQSKVLLDAQKNFAGVADKLNLNDEQDVQNLVDEIRYGERE